MEENKLQWKALEEDYDPNNKFTKKEEKEGFAEESVSSHEESGEAEESEEEKFEDDINEEAKILRYSTEEPARKISYTHNSSTPNKDDRTSTF